MELESLHIDEGSGTEVGGEQSERAREQSERAKKTQAQLQKVQKDEKKAHQDDTQLFLILQKFIQDPYYEGLIADVNTLLNISTPSRAVLMFIGLFYPDATYYIATETDNKNSMHLMISLYKYEQQVPFHESELHISIRKWITEWVSLMDQFLTHAMSSKIMMQRFLDLLQGKEHDILQQVLGNFFVFFFFSRNVTISLEQSMAYAAFVQKNLITTLQNALQDVDETLKKQEENIEDIILSNN